MSGKNQMKLCINDYNNYNLYIIKNIKLSFYCIAQSCHFYLQRITSILNA